MGRGAAGGGGIWALALRSLQVPKVTWRCSGSAVFRPTTPCWFPRLPFSLPLPSYLRCAAVLHCSGRKVEIRDERGPALVRLLRESLEFYWYQCFWASAASSSAPSLTSSSSCRRQFPWLLPMQLFHRRCSSKLCLGSRQDCAQQ